jgi:hypothetical protein
VAHTGDDVDVMALLEYGGSEGYVLAQNLMRCVGSPWDVVANQLRGICWLCWGSVGSAGDAVAHIVI